MITSDNYIVCYVLSTKTYHNSQPSTFNSQLVSTLNSKLSTCFTCPGGTVDCYGSPISM